MLAVTVGAAYPFLVPAMFYVSIVVFAELAAIYASVFCEMSLWTSQIFRGFVRPNRTLDTGQLQRLALWHRQQFRSRTRQRIAIRVLSSRIRAECSSKWRARWKI